MSSRPQVVAPPVWMAAAVCWVVQLSLEWTDRGVLARSSLADAVVLVRGGGVEAAVPTSVAAYALVLPVAGVLLAGLAGVRGRVARVLRLLVALVGVVAVVVAVRVVPQDDVGLGAGGHWAFAGCVLAFVAVGVEVVGWLREAAADAPRRRPSARRASTVLAVVGLVVALGLGGRVVGVVVAHDVGADSPRQAAVELVGALVERDAVAALAVTAPDEVPGLVETFLDLRERLAADPGGDDGGSGGTSVADVVTLAVDRVGTEVEVDGADRARVTLVSGHYEVRADLDALPGPFSVLEALFPDGRIAGDLGDLADSPLAILLGDDALLVTIETVRVDGRWYVADLADAVTHVGEVLVGYDDAVPDVDELPGLLLDRLLPSE